MKTPACLQENEDYEEFMKKVNIKTDIYIYNSIVSIFLGQLGLMNRGRFLPRKKTYEGDVKVEIQMLNLV